MDSNGIVSQPLKAVNSKFSPKDNEYLELAKEPEKNETKFRDMFETAVAKVVENKKTVEARTKSSQNLEIKKNEQYNGSVSHSLKDKCWRTDLNEAQFRELDVLQRVLEVIENGESAIGIQRNIDRLLGGNWVQGKHNLENNNAGPGERIGDTGNASVLQGESSEVIGSKAFRNVVKNIFGESEQKRHLLKDSKDIAFNAAQDKQSAARSLVKKRTCHIRGNRL